jgi:HK97 family phage major capsid protein
MPTSPLDLVRANNRRRMDIQTQLRQIDEGTIVNADTNEVRSYNDDETAEITKLRSELTEIDARLVAQLELEQRSHEINSGIDSMLGSMLDRQGGDLVDNRSIGERFTSDEYRSWAEQGGRGKFYVDLPGMELRAVTDTTLGVGQQGYGSSASGGVLTRPQRLGRVGQDFLDRRVYLMDELPTISVTQGNIEYVQDKTPLADLANAAREVAESGQKPQGGATFQVVSEAAAVIAEWVNMTRQVVADVPQIQSYLDGRLRYGLKRRADAQIIAGLHAVNAFTGGIVDGGARSAWGLRQIRSTAIASGTALLIDPTAVAIFDRQQVQAYMTDSHASNFTSNILTLLLEVRLGLGVFNPAGIAKVTFNGTV